MTDEKLLESAMSDLDRLRLHLMSLKISNVGWTDEARQAAQEARARGRLKQTPDSASGFRYTDTRTGTVHEIQGGESHPGADHATEDFHGTKTDGTPTHWTQTHYTQQVDPVQYKDGSTHWVTTRSDTFQKIPHKDMMDNLNKGTFKFHSAPDRFFKTSESLLESATLDVVVAGKLINVGWTPEAREAAAEARAKNGQHPFTDKKDYHGWREKQATELQRDKFKSTDSQASPGERGAAQQRFNGRLEHSINMEKAHTAMGRHDMYTGWLDYYASRGRLSGI